MSWPLDLFDKVLIVSKIHLLTESSVDWLKQQAKALKKSNSITLSQAQYELAVRNGFLNWKNLVETFKYETRSTSKIRIIDNKNKVLSEYTDEQKIGARARKLGINPANIKNSIYVTIPDSDEVFSVDVDQWENLGLYEDFGFFKWLQDNDPYFSESTDVQIFRLISIDTHSYKEVNKFIQKIGKKLDFFFPLYAQNIWINGKYDPDHIADLKEELREYFPDSIVNAHDLPLAEIPTIAWKRGY